MTVGLDDVEIGVAILYVKGLITIANDIAKVTNLVPLRGQHLLSRSAMRSPGNHSCVHSISVIPCVGVEASRTKYPYISVLVLVQKLDRWVEDTHRMGTPSSKTAGSTSTHMSKDSRTSGDRKPYGASPRRRQKQGLVAQSDSGANHASRDPIPPEKMIPLGFHVNSLTLVVHGSSSAKTPRARRRRKIRWLV